MWLFLLGSWVSIYLTVDESIRAGSRYDFVDSVIASLKGIPFSLLFYALPIAIYVFLTYRYGPTRILERETRCRKCGYILRGITEPRCPECGERI
jgi:hypothetical protein